jgi:phosphoenolpyruvate carboxylase
MNELPKALKEMVRRSVAVLGQVLEEELGIETFSEIQWIREKMKSLRGSSHNKTVLELENLHHFFKKKSKSKRQHFAHSFSLMLEIINTCESAYRTHRLRAKNNNEKDASRNVSHLDERPKEDIQRIVYVLTAHPTESRSAELIWVMKHMQDLMIEAYRKGDPGLVESDLYHWIRLAWMVPAHRKSAPSVKDEAEHIYSFLLSEEILDLFSRIPRVRTQLFVRTWVGGDKDGHPGVDQRALRQSLQSSREKIAVYLHRSLAVIHRDLLVLEKSKSSKAKKLLRDFSELRQNSEKIETLKNGDGTKIRLFFKSFKTFCKSYQKLFRSSHKVLDRMESLFEMFPALVVPLELRESSDVIESCLMKSPKKAIIGMLKTLRALAGPLSLKFYASGFVVSMTKSDQDVLNAFQLTKKHLENTELPIIPLFEDENSLEQSPKIVERLFENRSFSQAVQKKWANRFEMMLGYSDSAKESGPLKSRLLIAESVRKLDRLLIQKNIRPIFFHGSGGSVARGGGSLQEQISWWPKSALASFKVTVQGEMVQRNFSSPEVLRSQLEKIAHETKRAKTSKLRPPSKSLMDFSDKAAKSYQERIGSDHFIELVEKATAYQYLNELKIGSRPVKRKGSLSLKSIRAIPWVLSWTQVRALLPAWWGVGSAWASATEKEKSALRDAFKNQAVFRSFVKTLSFTLDKVELSVWDFYLEKSSLTRNQKEKTKKDFSEEYKNALIFVQQISGESQPIWFRPWLHESIMMRSPMIHPLNVLQVIAADTKDIELLRETVTGIACGMLTTG